MKLRYKSGENVRVEKDFALTFFLFLTKYNSVVRVSMYFKVYLSREKFIYGVIEYFYRW